MKKRRESGRDFENGQTTILGKSESYAAVNDQLMLQLKNGKYSTCLKQHRLAKFSLIGINSPNL